jgi:PAS domain S-box-containing protein
MFDNSFLKKLNILYIESNYEDRDYLSNILYRFFNNVIVCSNALDAIKSFTQKDEDFFIDIIICDRTLSDSTGIEVLKQIREIDFHVPFIFTSSNIETSDLLLGINHNITDYLAKPVNAKDLIFCIQKVCHKRYQDRLKILMQKDLEDLRLVVNEVALVVRTDLHGNISFVNNYFSKISGFSQDELLGKNYRLLKNENSNNHLYEELLLKVNQGIIWEGKVKKTSKSKEDFYVYLTVLPIHDKDNSKITELMWISFLTTDQELENKEFKKEMVKNIYTNRRINNEAREEIDKLMARIAQYSSVKSELLSKKQEAVKLNNEIESSKKELLNIEEKVKKSAFDSSLKIEEAVSKQKNIKEENEKILILLNNLNNELKDKNQKLLDLTKQLSSKLKEIKKL